MMIMLNNKRLAGCLTGSKFAENIAIICPIIIIFEILHLISFSAFIKCKYEIKHKITSVMVMTSLGYPLACEIDSHISSFNRHCITVIRCPIL